MENSSLSTSTGLNRLATPQDEKAFEEIRKIIWNITLQDALFANICIHCKKSIVLQMEAPEDINWHQYEISGYCPTCFKLSILQPLPPKRHQTRRAK